MQDGGNASAVPWLDGLDQFATLFPLYYRRTQGGGTIAIGENNFSKRLRTRKLK